jgi:hypothetical protein
MSQSKGRQQQTGKNYDFQILDYYFQKLVPQTHHRSSEIQARNFLLKPTTDLLFKIASQKPLELHKPTSADPLFFFFFF